MNNDTMSNVVLMGTFWNEIEWVNVSLAQIYVINPKKVILCDGCFDPKYDNYSTDGTNKVIKDYCNSNSNAVMINAVRKTKFQHLVDWIKYKNDSRVNFIPKILGLVRLLRTNIYRLNQMATFQYMLTELSGLKEGDWFMTYDCDQFYSDAVIEVIKDIEKFSEYNILTSRENTFFESFDMFTDEYEKRDYNNMPHRYIDGLRFIPTRHPARINKLKYENCSDFEKKKKFVGDVYHYHIKSPERKKAGYSLGDRKEPSSERQNTRNFNGKHPKIIIEKFGLE
jgi:hypothetical protein